MKKYITTILCSLLLSNCSTVDSIFVASLNAGDFAADKPFPVNVVLYPAVIVSASITVPIAIVGLALEVY